MSGNSEAFEENAPFSALNAPAASRRSVVDSCATTVRSMERRLRCRREFDRSDQNTTSLQRWVRADVVRSRAPRSLDQRIALAQWWPKSVCMERHVARAPSPSTASAALPSQWSRSTE
jgi:hypothetical protein